MLLFCQPCAGGREDGSVQGHGCQWTNPDTKARVRVEGSESLVVSGLFAGTMSGYGLPSLLISSSHYNLGL